jgi:dTDP-4-amino-4,6-dideoxygalactose transaminase
MTSTISAPTQSVGNTTAKRIYLSPPHMGEDELQLVQEVFASNWIAPLGSQVDAFEAEVAACAGRKHGAALSSGTAALHLALQLLGIGPGDRVLCPTLTFIASANPIKYMGGEPVFLDSEAATWNLNPQLLIDELRESATRGQLPKALITVDLYGQCADYDAILAACAEYSVPVIEDAAEALGATYKNRPAGGFGTMGIFSFNGNKIITTSGGGMLVSDDKNLIERARFLATQARDAAPHYEHSVVGYNYRLSNVLAAIGRGQLRCLPDRIAARGRNRALYQKALKDLPGISFMPLSPDGKTNHWLTCVLIEPVQFGATREDVRLALEAQNIEARPTWKPLHLQPVFADCSMRGGPVAEAIFERGLCLPSGSSLTEDELQRIVSIIVRTHKGQ